MKVDITKEEALSLLQHAAMEPIGLLVHASDPSLFVQALYRAKREDVSLADLQIRKTLKGIAICHPPEPLDQSVPKLESEDDTEIS